MLEELERRSVWIARNVLPHEAALRVWLRRRPAAAPEIDDVVQETYAIFAAMESVDQIQNPKTYMYSVARTVVLKHLRRHRIIPIEAMAELERLSVPADEADPERAVADRQELRQLASMIAALPDKCRQAFTLRKVEGLSQRETAARMGVSESTIEKHIGKGLRLLLGAMTGAATPNEQESQTAVWRAHGAADGRRHRPTRD